MRNKFLIAFFLASGLFILSTKGAVASSQIPVCGTMYATAVALPEGDYIGGTIPEEVPCYYYITVPQAYELKIDYNLTAETFFGDVTLYDNEMRTLSQSYEKIDTLRWLGAGGGASSDTYYFVISNSYTTDSYTLNVELVDRADAGSGGDVGGSFETAKEISYGEYIGYVSDYLLGPAGGRDLNDYYRVAVESGDSVTVQITPEGSGMVGLAVYDNKRDELYNEEGADLTNGEIVQQTFDIAQDSYLYVVVQWPYFGSSDGGINKYTLLVTNGDVNNLGGTVNTENTDTGITSGAKTSVNLRNTLILVFSIVLVVLLVIFAIVVIAIVMKKNRGGTQTKTSVKPEEPKEPQVEKVEPVVSSVPATPTPEVDSSKKVEVTVEEGTQVDVKTRASDETATPEETSAKTPEAKE